MTRFDFICYTRHCAFLECKNYILIINVAGFNKTSYVIRDGIVYRDTRLDCDPLVIQNDGDFRIYDDL